MALRPACANVLATSIKDALLTPYVVANLVISSVRALIPIAPLPVTCCNLIVSLSKFINADVALVIAFIKEYTPVVTKLNAANLLIASPDCLPNSIIALEAFSIFLPEDTEADATPDKEDETLLEFCPILFND